MAAVQVWGYLLAVLALIAFLGLQAQLKELEEPA